MKHATCAAPVCGLRERKKRRTRDALIRAAIELFVVKGYERTTVDEIAAEVEVSQRTFFRYFAGKEEVALALEDIVEAAFVGAVAERPAGEAPFEALRAALNESWHSIGAVIAAVVPLPTYMAMYRVIESTPTLLSAQMRHSALVEEQLASVIAAREGLDPADPRPRVLVSAVGGVIRAAQRLWGNGDETTVESIRRITEEHLDLLVPVLAQPWDEHRGLSGISLLQT
ncbi:TetR/AcrR family transcriptional regulator [Actinacidiphila sp. bgisy167]|uniref:TetR/AcrR family transcriptional regulator n=1 Tax=Actinacidiphila sp. bgisy167 TaxID=3413797 RepID=UPI003D74B19A